MKKLLIYFLLFLNIYYAKAQNGLERKDSICVTIKELIKNPKKYDKKYIALTGFVVFEEKGRNAIFISEDDYKNRLYNNSVWFLFLIETSSYHIVSKYNKTFATVVGIFNKGKMSQYNQYLKKEIKTKNGVLSSISTIY